jgi:hypothetical protein
MGNSNFGTNYPVWYKMEPPLIINRFSLKIWILNLDDEETKTLKYV